MKTIGDWVDLGHGHEMKLVTLRDEIIGGVLRHPVLGTYAPETEYPMCEDGLVQWEPSGSTMRPLFTLESGPGRAVSLSPFVVCQVCGDKGWIVGGEWHPKTDDDGLGTQPDMPVVKEGNGDDSLWEMTVRRDLGDKVLDEELDADRRLIDVTGRGGDVELDGEDAIAHATEQERMRAEMEEAPEGEPGPFDAPAHVHESAEDTLDEIERNVVKSAGRAIPLTDEMMDDMRRHAQDTDWDGRTTTLIERATEDESLRKSLLDEAASLILGDRNNAYGPPHQDFQRTADMVTAMWGDKLIDGARIEAHDIAQFVICIKLSRLQWSPQKRDNWTDIVGYAGCGYEAFRLTHPEIKET